MLKREVHPRDLIAHAKRHQAAFDELWIVEDLPYAGGIAQAAAVLANTERVVVGHGIAPAPFRNPAALAMEWATLAELFPDRFVAGLGHGVQSWMDAIGARPASPLTLLRETHDAVSGLLAGERLNATGTYVQLADQALEFPPANPPPISMGVVGPRSLELSGEVSTGTILPEGHGPDEIASARRHLTAGAERAGRNPEEHHLTVFAAFHVGRPDAMAPRNPEAPTIWEAVDTDVRKVTQRLRDLVDAGVDSIVLVALGRDIDAQLDLAAQEILPLLTNS